MRAIQNNYKIQKLLALGALMISGLVLLEAVTPSPIANSIFWLSLILLIALKAFSGGTYTKVLSKAEQIALLDSEIREYTARFRSSSIQNRSNPASDSSTFAVDLISPRQKKLKKLAVHSFWDTNDGLLFEKKCAEYYEVLGYRVKSTPRSGDNGIDLIAERQGETCHIQCKAWSRQVGRRQGVELIQRTFGASQQYVARGSGVSGRVKVVIIARNGFSEPAYTAARDLDVSLLDVDKLIAKVKMELSKPASHKSSSNVAVKVSQPVDTRPVIIECVSRSQIERSAAIPTENRNGKSLAEAKINYLSSAVESSDGKRHFPQMTMNYGLRKMLSSIKAEKFEDFEKAALDCIKEFCDENGILYKVVDSLVKIQNTPSIPSFIKSEVIVARMDFYHSVRTGT